MSAGQQNRSCSVPHYMVAAQCTQSESHDDLWHRTVHPDTGQVIRFRTVPGAQHTQEWEPDDDPEATDAGEWVTWHYTAREVGPTPIVPADLDQRVAALIATHFPTGGVRHGQAGIESECGCGTWYPISRDNAHLGREVSLLVRGYFDLALRHGGRCPR